MSLTKPITQHRPKKSNAPALAGMLGVVVCAMVVTVVCLYLHERSGRAKQEAPAFAPTSPAAPAAKTGSGGPALSTAASQDPKPGSSLPAALDKPGVNEAEKGPGLGATAQGSAGQGGTSPAPPTTETAPPADPVKREKFVRDVAAIRAALVQRDLDKAKLLVKEAAAAAQADEESAELARLDVLIDNLREFWKTLADVVRKLEPTHEFTINNTPVIVVETGASGFTVRSEGRNRNFAIRDLPRPMVDALYQTGFADTPANKVLYGTYLAFDPQGDRGMARQIWRQAIDAGQEIKQLMPELDVAPAASAEK